MRNTYKQIRALMTHDLLDGMDFFTFYKKVEDIFIESNIRTEPSDKRILIPIYNGIGDCILSTAFVKQVHKCYPESDIIVMCGDRHKCLFKNLPYVNQIVSCYDSNYANVLTIMIDALDVCEEDLWDIKPTLSFQPKWCDSAFPAMASCWLSGCPQRIGYGENDYKRLWKREKDAVSNGGVGIFDESLLTTLLHKPLDTHLHDLEAKLYVLEFLGHEIDYDKIEVDVRVSEDIIDKVNQRFKLNEITNTKIAIGIGGAQIAKKYPIAKLAKALEQIENATFIISGGIEDGENGELLQRILGRDRAINTAGLTSLEESLAIFKQCDLYIGNDTSTAHMAAAFNKPSIVLYKQAADKNNIKPAYLSSILRFHPWHNNYIVVQGDHALEECKDQLAHGGCIYNEIPHCINTIKPQQIIDAYEEMMIS